MTHANAENISPDPYGDLEKPVTDIRNMAAMVAQTMEHHGGIDAGDVTIDKRSWEAFSFAVYHLQELIDGLFAQYFQEAGARASTSS